MASEPETFRLGTNARGYAIAGGLLVLLAVVLAWAALALAFRIPRNVQGGRDPFSIAVAALGVVSLGYLGVKMIQIRCVVRRDGLVVYNLVGRVRRIDAQDIVGFALRPQAGRSYRYHVPAVILRSGEEIKVRALALGRTTDPPVPEQVAAIAEIQRILGLPS
jgi:hypothetical protein